MARADRILCLWVAMAAASTWLDGCAPARPPLFEASALQSAGQVLVLPLADAPGPKGKDSGQLARGMVADGLTRAMKKASILCPDLAELEGKLAGIGYSMEDCSDPVVAGALGRLYGADLVATGELSHFGPQQELGGRTILIVSSSETRTTYWVSLGVKIVACKDNSIVYQGAGTASSLDGYGPAGSQAARQSLLALSDLLERGR